jgi:WD40 repeat protein
MIWPPSELLGAKYWPNASPDEKAMLIHFFGDVKRRSKYVDPRDRKNQSMEPPIVYWTMLGLWDMHAGKMKDSFRVDAEDLDRLTLSGNRKTLAGVGKEPARPGETIVFVWDLTNGKEICHFALPEADRSTYWPPIAVSMDGRTLISGPHLSGIKGLSHFRTWDIATGKERAKFEYRGDIAYPGVVFFEGRLAAVWGNDTINVLDLTTGKVLRQFKGHDGKIISLAFSADGQRLVSAGADTTLLVWDLSRLGAAEK